MPPFFRASSRRAFTLVELLVAVAVIAVLASLLLPGLATARRRADSVHCLSNLRQLHAAIASYASDNDGYFPPTQLSGSDLWWWRLNPYLTPEQTVNKASAVLVCPSVLKAWRKVNLSQTGNYPTYGMNMHLGGSTVATLGSNNPQVRFANVRNPPHTILVADAGFNSSTTFASLSTPAAWIGQHQGCTHILFVDGHVEVTPVTAAANPSLSPYNPGGTQDMWSP